MEEKKLDELTEQAKSLENKTDPMIPEKPAEKKKVGRPKKNKDAGSDKAGLPPEQAARSQAAAKVPNALLVKPLMPLISAAGVGIAGHSNAALKPDEAEALAQALGLVMDKYMPNAFEKYGPEIMLAMTFGQYGLRVYATRKLIQQGEIQSDTNPQNQQSYPHAGTGASATGGGGTRPDNFTGPAGVVN